MGGVWGTGKVSRTCLKCDVVFEARHDRPGRYCSRSCAGKDHVQPNYRVSKTCEVCDLDFVVKRYRQSTARFCSWQCRAISCGRDKRGSNHPNWKGGISERTHASRMIIAKAKKAIGRCQRCDAIGQLHGHHKEKWADSPGLRECADNIEILCTDCHAAEHPEFANMLHHPVVRSGSMLDCQACGKPFYVSPYKVKNGSAKYCSLPCKYRGASYGREMDTESNTRVA